MATTIEVSVAATTDTVYRRLVGSGTPDNFSISFEPLIAGAWSPDWYQLGCGLRFRNVHIDDTKPITAAYLKVSSYAADSNTEVKTRISAEDVDDASDFSGDNAASFDTRWANRTTARVDWDDMPSWAYHEIVDSPSIVSVIQEIVARAGWRSGNDIVIFWDDFDDRSAHGSYYKAIDGYISGTGQTPPVLHIEYDEAPTVTNQLCSDIVTTTATGNGRIESLGSASVTEHGHCWNTTGNPTTSDSKTTNGAGSVGAFTSAVTGLTEGTRYFIRAYATNSAGTSYGAALAFRAGDPVSQMLDGNLAVIGTGLHYIDWDGNERVIKGALVV